MTSKLFAGIVCTAFLAVTAFGQDSQIKLNTAGAPSLRILSAPINLDLEKRKATLELEIENISDKTIKGFAWVYQTQGVVRDYKVSIEVKMPEVTVTLAPKEQKKVIVLTDAQVPQSILNMPSGEIKIVSVFFEDGSWWSRSNEK